MLAKKSLSVMLAGIMFFSILFNVFPQTFNVSAQGGMEELSSYIVKESSWNCSVLGTGVGITIYSKSREPITAPTVIYILNHGMERVGLEDDLPIVSDFLEEGYTVVAVDYRNAPQAVSPKLDASIFEIRRKVDDQTLLAGTGISRELNRIYIVPSGYRMKRDCVYWDYYKHAPFGVLNRIVANYNEKVVPEFGKTPVTFETILDMERPDGSPVDFALRMDVIYPSQTNKRVPVMMIQSTLSHRNRNESSTSGGARYHYIGFLMRGYAYANYDHTWLPLAQEDHYGYDMFIYASTMANSAGLAANTAAVRFIKAHSDLFNADTENIGVWGHSKAAQGSLQLSNPHHMEWSERSTYPFKDKDGNSGPYEPQPWQGYTSLVAASYQTMGTGTGDYARETYISDEDAKDQIPTITACGDRDQHGAWNYWFDQRARLDRLDVPYLGFNMYGLGHTYIHGFDTDYQIDRYEAVFDFFDRYLKPEVPPKVIYTLPYNGKTDVLPDEEISVKFAPNMDSGTIEGLSVVRKSDGTEAAGTWTELQRGSMFKWKPTEELSLGEEYEIRVRGDVKDTNGLSMGAHYISSFSTADISIIDVNSDATVEYGAEGENINENFGSDDWIKLRNVASAVNYTNVALFDGVKTTRSNLSPSAGGDRLRDGLKDAAASPLTTNDANIMWATASTNPWAQYDLGKEVLVDKIVLYTANASGNRCSRFKVEKANSSAFNSGVEELGVFQSATGIPNEGAVVEFDEPTLLQHIRFTSLSNTTTGYVYYTEFEVWGYVFDEENEAAGESDANYSSKGYIKFSQDKDLSNATYAELRFTTANDPQSGKITDKEIDIYGLVGDDTIHDWKENEITWQNAPGNNTASPGLKTTQVYGGDKIESIKNTEAKEYRINVTDYIKSLNGTDATFILLEPERTLESTPITHIYSKEGAAKEGEGANPPQLLLTFEPPTAQITVPKRFGISPVDSKITFTCDNFDIDTTTLQNASISDITEEVTGFPAITDITEHLGTVTIFMRGLQKGGVYEINMSGVKSTEATGALTVPDIIFTAEAGVHYTAQFYKDVQKVTARLAFAEGSEKYLSANKPLMVMTKYSGGKLIDIATKPIESPIWFYDDFNYDGEIPPAAASTGWSGAGSTSVFYKGQLPDGIPGQPPGIKRALVKGGTTGAYRYRSVEPAYSSSYIEAWFYDDGVINSSSYEARYGTLWARVQDGTGANVSLFAGLRESGVSYHYAIGTTTTGKTIPRENGWYKVAFDFTSGNGYRVLINDIQVHPNPDESGVEEGDVDPTYTSFDRFSVGSNGWTGEQAPYGLAMARTSIPGSEIYSISLDGVTENDEVRLFVWDSLSGMQPLGQPVYQKK